MQVHVSGYPGVFQDDQVGHAYAIIPAEITETYRNQMTLSAESTSGLFESAIVRTERRIPVGYIHVDLKGLQGNTQYQSHGFTLQGIPHDLPSSLPTDAEDGTKGEL